QTIELMSNVLVGAEGEERELAAARIQGAVTLLIRMIDDLSDASGIETRQLAVEPRPTELRALALDVAERCAAVTPGLQVQCEAPVEAWALADPARVEQVLSNLLSNAAKDGREGADVLVRIEARQDVVELAVDNE